MKGKITQIGNVVYVGDSIVGEIDYAGYLNITYCGFISQATLNTLHKKFKVRG